MPIETSIIIRTLNESKHLEKLLSGIHGQNYHDWEIILVDSGSTDDTLAIAKRYGVRIFHIPQAEFTFGRSLNQGCREALGDYLVFASGHVWPTSNNWLRNLVNPFEEASIGMVYGRQKGTDANRLSEFLDMRIHFGRNSNILVDEPKGNNGNAAIRRDLWLHQPFDESLHGLEDMDWAKKIQRKGYRIYYSADAAVYHVHEETLKQVFHRYRREATTYKQMFPRARFAGAGMAKSLPQLITRDVIYALKKRKLGKLFQIPGSRLAQTMGIYSGFEYQKRLSKKVIPGLMVPETYQVVQIDRAGQHQINSRLMPELQPGQVTVQVAYVGVCNAGISGGKHEESTPIELGHEFSGIVLQTGAQVHGIRKGQKVGGTYVVGCGSCRACDEGDFSRCSGRPGMSDTGDTGAYAEYLVVPSGCVHKLPWDMSLKHGAMLESVALCLAGLKKLDLESDRSVCVAGAGPVGNICAQILHTRGLRVTVVDENSRWLSLLYKYDIDTLTKLDGLENFDYLIDASGYPKVLEQLVEGSGPQAQILHLGPPCTRPGEDISTETLGHENLVRSSGIGQPIDWEEAARLVKKEAIDLDDHTAAVEPLEAYSKAWEDVRSRREFKVILKVSEVLEAL